MDWDDQGLSPRSLLLLGHLLSMPSEPPPFPNFYRWGLPSFFAFSPSLTELFYLQECIAIHLPHRGVSRPQIKKYDIVLPFLLYPQADPILQICWGRIQRGNRNGSIIQSHNFGTGAWDLCPSERSLHSASYFDNCTDCLHLGLRGKVELAPKSRLTNASSKEVWFTVWH